MYRSSYSLPCLFFIYRYAYHQHLHPFPTRRSSDLGEEARPRRAAIRGRDVTAGAAHAGLGERVEVRRGRSEEHTSELQSREKLVCRLLLEKKYQLPAQSHTYRSSYSIPWLSNNFRY